MTPRRTLALISATIAVGLTLSVTGPVGAAPRLLEVRPAAVLTGDRPASKAGAADLQRLVDQAYALFAGVKEGANADYIPELAKVPSSLFGVVIATVDGEIYAAGDADFTFAIESVSKPFTAALVMQQSGFDELETKVGVEPTGFPFNSIEAIALQPSRTGNALVNAGAISTVSLVQAKDPRAKYQLIEDWLSDFAGSDLAMLPDVYRSEITTAVGNRAIAALLAKYGRIYADPAESLDVYTRQCSVGVTAKQLAVMGATLANGGVNPVTGKRVMATANVPRLLALMMMAGFYDESGAWATSTGLPSKTGVGGGIVSVVPGKMAIVGFSPPLNRAGNSVRAARAIQYIARELDANVFGRG